MAKTDFKSMVELGIYREVYDKIEEPYYLQEAGEPSKNEQARYLAGTALGFVLPFGSRLVGRFKTNEYYVTHLQLNDPEIKNIFLQIPILRTPFEHATIFSIVAIVKRPIPETVIAIGEFINFIPYSPLKNRKGLNVRKIIKQKINWNSLLDALNRDRELKNMISSLPYSEMIGSLKTIINKGELPGYVRLIPYKGWTIMELVVAPIHISPNELEEESFVIERCVGVFKRILSHIKMYGVKQEDIGIIPLGSGNQHSVLRAVERIEEFSSGNPPLKQYSREPIKDFQVEKLKVFEGRNNLLNKKYSRNKMIYSGSFLFLIMVIVLILINRYINILGSFLVCFVFLSGLVITLSLVLGVYLWAANTEIKKKISRDQSIITHLKKFTGL